MADDEKTEETGKEEESEGGGKSSILVIAGAAVAALVIGAGGAYVAIKPDAERMAELEAQLAEAADEGGDASDATSENPCAAKKNPCGDSGNPCAPAFSERVIALAPFVVNITGHDYARYLKVKVELEAESPAVRGELEERLPQVRDGVIVLLSSRRLADVTDFEGKVLLKAAILERVNGMLESGQVRQVMFTEFVVQ